MPSFIWLIIAAVFVLFEAATVSLVCIWFAGGALVAAIAAMFGVPGYVQIILFVLISCVLLIFTRPVAVKYFNKDRMELI